MTVSATKENKLVKKGSSSSRSCSPSRWRRWKREGVGERCAGWLQAYPDPRARRSRSSASLTVSRMAPNIWDTP